MCTKKKAEDFVYMIFLLGSTALFLYSLLMSLSGDIGYISHLILSSIFVVLAMIKENYFSLATKNAKKIVSNRKNIDKNKEKIHSMQNKITELEDVIRNLEGE